MQRGKKTTENGASRRKIGSLALWIAAQKVAAQTRLDRARQALTQSPDVVYEREAANMTGQLVVLGQIDAILAGEVEIPEPDLPAEPDSEDEAMHRQDCELQVALDERGASDGTVHVAVFADKAVGHIHQGPSGKYQWYHCRVGEEAQTGKADSLQQAREQMEYRRHPGGHEGDGKAADGALLPRDTA